jgi:hypothetical protein
MKRRAVSLIVKRDVSRDALHAGRDFRRGEIVLDFAEVEWRTERDADTVQHPSGGHIYHPLLARVAHSCEPNCEILAAGRVLVAIRPVAAGDAITFDYQTTESRFARPFECHCGSARCRGRVG